MTSLRLAYTFTDMLREKMSRYPTSWEIKAVFISDWISRRHPQKRRKKWKRIHSLSCQPSLKLCSSVFTKIYLNHRNWNHWTLYLKKNEANWCTYRIKLSIFFCSPSPPMHCSCQYKLLKKTHKSLYSVTVLRILSRHWLNTTRKLFVPVKNFDIIRSRRYTSSILHPKIGKRSNTWRIGYSSFQHVSNANLFDVKWRPRKPAVYFRSTSQTKISHSQRRKWTIENWQAGVSV